jgi:hypothetical protein
MCFKCFNHNLNYFCNQEIKYINEILMIWDYILSFQKHGYNLYE